MLGLPTAATTACLLIYTLDVLGVDDNSEKNQMEVLTNFRETETRQDDGRYELNITWIPGACVSATNKKPSRRRLANFNRSLTKEYEKTTKDQLANGIVEKAAKKPTGKCVYYMRGKMQQQQRSE